MGNNVFCIIDGIRSTKIKMSNVVVRTLTEEIHVPELRKNLISLGVLDSKGYKYTNQGGIL